MKRNPLLRLFLILNLATSLAMLVFIIYIIFLSAKGQLVMDYEGWFTICVFALASFLLICSSVIIHINTNPHSLLHLFIEKKRLEFQLKIKDMKETIERNDHV